MTIGPIKKVWLVDFDDSFTYNICSELDELGLSVEVIHWSSWKKVLERIKKYKKRCVLVLGPGPGHPNEYQLDGLNQLHGRPDLFICGVCLGHQLIWQQLGLKISRCDKPVHGQQVEIKAPEWFDFLPSPLTEQKIRVQRYNSLCVKPRKEKMPLGVKYLVEKDELMAASFANTLTYQFHPESVGTSFRQSFFRPLLDFFV